MIRIGALPIILLVFALTHGVTNPPYGTVFGGYPFWEERAGLVWTNFVRQAPQTFKQMFLSPFTSTNSFLNQPAVPPLIWQYDLTRSARAHSTELIETCPNGPAGGSPHNSCNGEDAFVRIQRYYSPGGNAENLNQPPDSSYQYYHVPKHNVRAFVCDGTYQFTQSSGTGNQAWPTTGCPSDANAGHRKNIMDPTLVYVGIGVWGKGGNLINAAPQVTTQDFAQDPGTGPYYPGLKIYSGSHVFIGTGTGDNMQTMQFFANYFDASGAAPKTAQVWVQGTWMPLTCQAGWGPSASNCVYSSAVLQTQTACRLYFFQFTDGLGATQLYPVEGAFYTYGEGGCSQNWIPKATADPLIAAGGGTPPPTVATVAGAQTTPSVATMPPPAVGTNIPVSAGGFAPPPGTPSNTGFTGTRLRIRYNAPFESYVSNGAYIMSAVQILRNTTSIMLGVDMGILIAESISAGSTIVNWFILDGSVPGSAALIADAFIARFNSGTDLRIGNHLPSLLDTSIVSRAAILGSPGGTAMDIGIIVGAAVGGAVFIAAVIIAIIVIVRYRQKNSYTRVGGGGGAAAVSARYEPVASFNLDRSVQKEPLLSNEPILYLSRNSRVASSRVMSHQYGSPVGAGFVAPSSPRRLKARVLFDFDGASAPNCITVRQGEVVTVEDQTNQDWWDCRNANSELGFVPAKFLSLMADEPQQQRPVSPQQQQQAYSPRLEQQQQQQPKRAVSVKAVQPKVVHDVQPQVFAAPVVKSIGDRAVVLSDFDGRTIDNALSVIKGEEVVIVDKTNSDWYDCRNAAGDLGFVPASFLKEVKKEVPKPPAKVAFKKPVPKPPVKAAAIVRQPVVVDFEPEQEDWVEPEVEVNTLEIFPEEIPSGDDDATQTMVVSVVKKPVKHVGGPRKAAIKGAARIPGGAGAPRPAPLPGTHFVCVFEYKPVGPTETAARPGDQLVAPVGADLNSEWVYVLNRMTGLKGFVPATFIERKK